MALLPVAEAQERLLSLLKVLPSEKVALDHALGRVLSSELIAPCSQPPFAASAMDGYAVRSKDFALSDRGPLSFALIGEAKAGHPFEGALQEREAVRVFTGAPMPIGSDRVVLQEIATVKPGAEQSAECSQTHKQVQFDPALVLKDPAYVRPMGYDVEKGTSVLSAGACLTYRDLPLCASLNLDRLEVRRRPKVAVLATGDELRPVGSPLAAGQIISSVPYGVKALLEGVGAEVQVLGIARDDLDDLQSYIRRAAGADVLVTIGGASVGDHDLVQQALVAAGMTLDFWRIAMRPGKPLMVGDLEGLTCIGVPGNPVSALICCLIFVVPALKTMLGQRAVLPLFEPIILRQDLPANGAREHYMRGVLDADASGVGVRPLPDQDSSLQLSFAKANGLIVRPAHAPAVSAGALVDVIRL